MLDAFGMAESFTFEPISLKPGADPAADAESLHGHRGELEGCHPPILPYQASNLLSVVSFHASRGGAAW